MQLSTQKLLALTAFCGTLAPGSISHAAPKFPAPSIGKPNAQMAAVLKSLAELHPKPIPHLTPKQARMQPTPADAVVHLLAKQGRSTAPEPVGSVVDYKVPGPMGTMTTVRVYKPKNAPSGPLPVVVYFHGGGFVIASVATYDSSCRAISNGVGALVAAVAYPLAPEHRLPAAHEASYMATQYIMKNAAKWGGDPKKVAVLGESAGGNIATDMCLMAKMRGGMMPIHQVLVYPVVQGKPTPSYHAYYNAKPLSAPMMAWFFKYALPSKSFGKNPLASPLNAPDSMFKGLPPATIIAAQIDPLQSEGVAYASKLMKDGIVTKYRLYPGTTHEFFGMGAVLDEAKAAEKFASSELKTAFNK